MTTSAVIFSRGKIRSRRSAHWWRRRRAASPCIPSRRRNRRSARQVLQRIDVERIEIVGRQILRHMPSTRAASANLRSAKRKQAVDRRRCTSGRSPPRLAARQKSASRLRASSGPPRASPSASITALMAPADAPEMPSISSRPSSSRWSSTPQVKAPWAPPPCSARLMRLLLCGLRRFVAAEWRARDSK